MATTVRDVMTRNPVALPEDATLAQAARTMRDEDVGSVVVLRDSSVCGIVTDRDITIRAVAESRDPGSSRLQDICSGQLVSVSESEPVEKAVELMRRHSVRRLPVLEGGRPVGIVSLGDLAVERDPTSVLGEISAAEPNR